MSDGCVTPQRELTADLFYRTPICLFFRPSRCGIVSKQMKKSSFFHILVVKSFEFRQEPVIIATCTVK